MTSEREKLQQIHERSVYWNKWGPYISERAWGTVREDYSPAGTAWDYLPHDQARSKAYRWGEDGLAGICDRHQQLCFALALWNGRDPILKERLFGLAGDEGNHGEDVKEYYYYLDNTPSHSYMKYLYKYPQAAFPYTQLVAENRRRDRSQPEYELVDTGIFDEDRYFDVCVEYAKASPEDIVIRLTVSNRGPATASLLLLPTLWFRNTWSWLPQASRPLLSLYRPAFAFPTHQVIAARPSSDINNSHEGTGSYPGSYWLYCEGASELLFTENESNLQRLYSVPNASPYVKDAFHEYIVQGQHAAINPAQVGTKAAAHYQLSLAGGESRSIRLRLSNQGPADSLPFDVDFERTLTQALPTRMIFMPRSSPRVSRLMPGLCSARHTLAYYGANSSISMMSGSG